MVDQFAAIQQMMGNVQSVATQVGDLKRLFGNIKTRGGWGEAQLRQMLDDFLPQGAYETNVKLRDDSNDVVEFCILMPGGELIGRPRAGRLVREVTGTVADADAMFIELSRGGELVIAHVEGEVSWKIKFNP